MNERIKDKIGEIEGYTNELSPILPCNLNEYLYNMEKKAACERYFEKIIEAIVDLAFLIIKEKKLKTPKEDKDAFDVLFKEGIISQELAEKLQDAKGMRNILAHKYGTVNDEIVFHSIKEELGNDAKEFIKEIKKAL